MAILVSFLLRVEGGKGRRWHKRLDHGGAPGRLGLGRLEDG